VAILALGSAVIALSASSLLGSANCDSNSRPLCMAGTYTGCRAEFAGCFPVHLGVTRAAVCTSRAISLRSSRMMVAGMASPRLPDEPR